MLRIRFGLRGHGSMAGAHRARKVWPWAGNSRMLSHARESVDFAAFCACVRDGRLGAACAAEAESIRLATVAAVNSSAASALQSSARGAQRLTQKVAQALAERRRGKGSERQRRGDLARGSHQAELGGPAVLVLEEPVLGITHLDATLHYRAKMSGARAGSSWTPAC